MAKITTSALIEDISGSHQGSTFKRTKSGIILISRQAPRRPQSTRQQLLKRFTNQLSGDWYALPDANKALWNKYASLLPKPLSGFNAYLMLNTRILAADHAELTYQDTPPIYPLAPSPPSNITASNIDPTNISITWDTPVQLGPLTTPLRPSYTLWLPMNDPSGTIATDYSTFHHNATLATPSHVQTPFDRGLSFNGINDQLNTLPSSDFVSPTGALELWYKPTSTPSPNNFALLLSYNNIPTAHLGIIVDGQNIWCRSRWASESHPYHWSLTKTHCISIGHWTHILLLQNGIAPELYINGSFATTATSGSDLTSWTSDAPTGPHEMHSGTRLDPPHQYLHGTIDSIKVHNTTPSPQLINQNYNFTYVQIYAAPQVAYANTGKEKWTLIATVRSDEASHTYTHDWPSGTVLSFRARTIERWGRLSPWTHVIRHTV